MADWILIPRFWVLGVFLIIFSHVIIKLLVFQGKKAYNVPFICKPTFQCVEQLSSGDIKDIDDSIDSSAGQIFSIRALSVQKTKTEM